MSKSRGAIRDQYHEQARYVVSRCLESGMACVATGCPLLHAFMVILQRSPLQVWTLHLVRIRMSEVYLLCSFSLKRIGVNQSALVDILSCSRSVDSMPVPVSTTNPDGKGNSVHRNASLPSTGSLFSRLNANSAETAMQDKQREQETHWKDRNRSQNNSSVSLKSMSNCEYSIVCQHLQFQYTGGDGLPLPGTMLKLPTRQPTFNYMQ
jgi:hypothetical protein